MKSRDSPIVYHRIISKISFDGNNLWADGSVQSETGRIRFSESTVSSTELSEFFLALTEFPGTELSEFLSAYYLCANANSPSFLAELTEFAAELSEFSSPKQYSRNSIPPVPHSKESRISPSLGTGLGRLSLSEILWGSWAPRLRETLVRGGRSCKTYSECSRSLRETTPRAGLRVLSATFILSKNSRVLDANFSAKNQLVSANLS